MTIDGRGEALPEAEEALLSDYADRSADHAPSLNDFGALLVSIERRFALNLQAALYEVQWICDCCRREGDKCGK